MVDNAIIGGYLVGILGLGIWSGRKLRTLREFSISHANYGAFVVFATLSASFIGGGFSMGNASKVFLLGVGNIAALWAFSFKEILVAKLVVPNVGRFPGAISTGDIMGQAYGRPAQVITGFFSVFLCAGIMGAQVGAMGQVFQVFTGMPPIWGILIGCGIAIIYSTIGGMKAVIATDVVQFVILGVGIPATLIFGIYHVGGLDAMVAAVPQEHWSIVGDHMTLIAFASLFLTFLLGETLVPPYVQRLLIGRDLEKTARGVLWSGIFSIPFFAITGAIGLVALAMDPSMNETLAMPTVIKNAVPIGLRGIIVAGVISIVMSSADSFLNGAATGWVNDVLKPLSRRPLSNRAELLWARMTNLVTGALAVIVALSIPNVLDILIFAYNFWAPVILPALLVALLGMRVSVPACYAGIAAGIVGTVGWKYGFGDPLGFDGLVFGTFCNMAVYGVVARLTGGRKE